MTKIAKHLWATVCKTVRFMLSDRVRCPVCPAGLSEALVYCGQTVGWIKMKLGMEVCLGPGHIVYGDPPPKGHSPLPIFGHARPIAATIASCKHAITVVQATTHKRLE